MAGSARFVLLAFLVSAGWPATLHAQAPQSDPSPNSLNVFITCQGRGCDAEAFRSSLVWVNWVEEPGIADVRVDVTTAATPEGGLEYGLSFLASGTLQGRDDRLVYRAASTESLEEEQNGLLNVLSIGFARYAAILGFREFVSVQPTQPSGIDPDARIVSAQEVDDPWDLWVFTVGGSGNLNKTANRKTHRLNGNFSARKTTPTWKLSVSGRGSIRVEDITRSDGTILPVDQRDGSVTVGITYTLADHWSIDLSSLSGKFPTANQSFRSDITPGIEYSVFPYEEATRRSLIIRYTVAVTFRDYEERSIFGKLSEAPWEEAIQIRATMRQPWGDASSSITTSHILDGFDKHNVSLRGSLSFRLVRGLNFNVGGDISWVTDQVYLSAMGITDEEALLRLRTRRSDFNKGLNFGFSYQFGSIYNNTVNNRFLGVNAG